MSHVRPLVWVSIYLALVPAFAAVYYLIPRSEFHYPADVSTDFGSWIYYSVVTITTLGFGDFTPAGSLAQAVTALEAILGLVMIGFFLNAVSSLRSEIDLESELEKHRLLHQLHEQRKLTRNTPVLVHKINLFLSYCYAVTTPVERRKSDRAFNERFAMTDMRDLFKPSGLPTDMSGATAVEGLLRSARDLSLFLDSLQIRVDLSVWPDMLESCFTFVANCELFGSSELMKRIASAENRSDTRARLVSVIASWKGEVRTGKERELNAVIELYRFIRTNGPIARQIEEIALKSHLSDQPHNCETNPNTIWSNHKEQS